MAGGLADPTVEYEFDFESEEWERKKGERGDAERGREKGAVDSRAAARGKIH